MQSRAEKYATEIALAQLKGRQVNIIKREK